jgi:hypothetical protein
MKNQSLKKLAVTAGLAGLSLSARGATIVQNFSQTYALTASPVGSAPTINATWNVAQYNGFGGVTSLTKVQYDVTTQVYYRGTLIAVGTSLNYNLQVRSDFSFDLPGTAPTITAVDPTISQTGTSPGTTLTTFTAPTVGGGYPTPLTASSSATQLATDFAAYVGAGTVPVVATGSLLTTSSGGSYQNTSDIGLTTPYVFVDNAKVFPMFGLQEYSLVATLTVTYTVPEPGTYAAIGFVALVAGHQLVSRRKRRTPLEPAA